jgi:hypothetical protein
MRIDAILITNTFINREFDGVKSRDAPGRHNYVALKKQRSLRRSHPNQLNHFAAWHNFKIFYLIHQRLRLPAVTNALSCYSSPAAVRPNPLTTPRGSLRKKARPSRAALLGPNDRRPFRLRFRDGRSAPAPFPPSLRLRFPFPFAEPQAEATSQNFSNCGGQFSSLNLELGFISVTTISRIRGWPSTTSE